MCSKVDYIIVGQGLAGSILAYQLIQKGKSVQIIDETQGETASKKASGLINPITGRRFVKSWKIDELLPVAVQFYNSIEKTFQIQLVNQTKVHRIIQNLEQQNDWASKTEDERYSQYLKQKQIVYHNQKYIQNPLGCLIIEDVVIINTPLLVDTLNAFFIQKKCLLKEKFDYEALIKENDDLIYKNIKAKKVVFCEGYGVKDNPWFKDLPFLFSKGEALWFNSIDLSEDFILGASTNISPMGNKTFLVGATYAWNDLSLEITKAKRIELEEKLLGMINCTYNIVEHKAGVRPTVKDRRPLIGAHEEYSNLFIFNGMGTKGLSLAPFFALELIAHMESNLTLNEEVKLSRFKKID